MFFDFDEIVLTDTLDLVCNISYKKEKHLVNKSFILYFLIMKFSKIRGGNT